MPSFHLTFDDWKQHYIPIMNENGENTPAANILFSITERDLSLVTRQDFCNIWSLSEEPTSIRILPGLIQDHSGYVVGYFVTQLPWESDPMVELQVDINEAIMKSLL